MVMADLSTQIALLQQSVNTILQAQKEKHDEDRERWTSANEAFGKVDDIHEEVYGDDSKHIKGLKRVQSGHSTAIRRLQGFALVLTGLIALGYFGPEAKAAVLTLAGQGG